MDGAVDAASPLELLGVYESEETAESVCAQLRDAGADAHVIVPEDPEGEEVVRLALVAEQQEDTAEAKSSAQVGAAYPKEAAKGLAVVSPLIIPAAVLVGVLAALAVLPGRPIGARLVIGALVGGFGGSVISFVIGPAIAAPRPGVPAAAQRGVIVWSRSWDVAFEQLMASAEPIRLDRRLPDGVFEPVTTEDRSEGTSILTEITRNTTEAPSAGNDWEQGGSGGGGDRDRGRDQVGPVASGQGAVMSDPSNPPIDTDDPPADAPASDSASGGQSGAPDGGTDGAGEAGDTGELDPDGEITELGGVEKA